MQKRIYKPRAAKTNFRNDAGAPEGSTPVVFEVDNLNRVSAYVESGGGTPDAHHTTHENGGSDEISVAGLSGLLADGQTPLAHKTSHQSGGSDAIKLDDLAAPDNNTDLNVSTTAHGLTPILPNDATKFFDGTGNYDTVKDTDLSLSDTTTNNSGTGQHGFLKKLSNVATEYMDGTGAWSTPLSSNQKIASITIVIDGGGLTITTGIKGYLEIPFACTISAWTLLADQSGAIKIDVWKDTYGNFPPDNSDSITNGHEPEITASGSKAQDTDLSDWTTVSVTAGDILGFNVDSVTSHQRVTLALKVSKT